MRLNKCKECSRNPRVTCRFDMDIGCAISQVICCDISRESNDHTYLEKAWNNQNDNVNRLNRHYTVIIIDRYVKNKKEASVISMRNVV